MSSPHKIATFSVYTKISHHEFLHNSLYFRLHPHFTIRYLFVIIMSFTLVYHAPVIHRIHKTICPVNASSPQVPPVLPVFLRHSSPVTPKKPINTKVYRFFQQPLFSCPAPRVGLEPTTPRLTAVCSITDMNTYRKTRISKSLSHLLSDKTYIIIL